MDPHQDKNSFDSIIDQHFSKDIQQKRIKKELISLNELDSEYFKVSLQNTTIGLKVIVELSNELINMELEQNRNIKTPVLFELLLDSHFPFNLPRLFSRSHTYEPSLADARDYLEDVIQRPWSPTILLKEVITLLPKFLKRVNELPRWEDSQTIGKYHPGEFYSLEDLLGLDSVNLFTGEEVMHGDGQTGLRYLGVAESFFLKFEPTEKSRNIVKLLLWAPVHSIVNLKRGQGEDKTLIITFLDKDKKSGFTQNKFIMNENKKFIKLIMDMGLKYNVGISRALRDNIDLSQYVSKQTPRNRREKIEDLLQAITVFEMKLETELSKDLVYGLMGLYQKVVEHFATYEDPMYEDFVGRLRNLMERQDIQAYLRNEQLASHDDLNKELQENNAEEEEEKQGAIVKAPSPIERKNEKSDDGDEYADYQQQEFEVQRADEEKVKTHESPERREYPQEIEEDKEQIRMAQDNQDNENNEEAEEGLFKLEQREKEEDENNNLDHEVETAHIQQIEHQSQTGHNEEERQEEQEYQKEDQREENEVEDKISEHEAEEGHLEQIEHEHQPEYNEEERLGEDQKVEIERAQKEAEDHEEVGDNLFKFEENNEQKEEFQDEKNQEIVSNEENMKEQSEEPNNKEENGEKLVKDLNDNVENREGEEVGHKNQEEEDLK